MITSFTGEYHFLSNFYPWLGSSVEHQYQAAKTLDITEKTNILNAHSAGAAKRMGRRCKIRTDWDSIKLDIMFELLKQKFSNQDLKEKLLATEDEYLEEGNYWNDTYWGVCNGVGENHLGKLLMKLRGILA